MIATAAISRPQARTSSPQWSFVLLGTAFVSAVVFLWLPSMRSSLWLDEFGTFWVIKDGWLDAWQRGFDYHGQPIYYVVAWICRHVFGVSEIGLRLPSLFAMAGTAYLVWRIGRRLWDSETGLLAAIVFGSSTDVAFAAVDARPYAMLYLAGAGATLLLIRWLDEPKRRYAIVYVPVAALMVHLQLLALPVLAAHGIYALWRTWREPDKHRTLVMMAVALSALIAPAIASLDWFQSRRATFSFSGRPRLADLFWFAIFPLLMGGVAALVQKRRGRRPGRHNSSHRGRAVLPIALLAFPPLILFFVSLVSSTHRVFYPRYYGIAILGVALVTGWVFRQVRPQAYASLLALLLVSASIWDAGITTEHFETDWRAAAAFARSRASADTPILVQAGYVESVDVRWLRDPEKSSYLLSPVSYYEIVGEAVPLPFQLDARSRAYLQDVSTGIAGRREFLVVNSGRSDILTDWFVDRAGSLGMALQEYRRFGLISVAHFQAVGAA